LQNPAPAPDIALHDYLGRRVDLASYHGKAVLLTFIYTHCPDTCPLIVATLHNALTLLGRHASQAQIVAVSTDPKGDTRAAISAFLARREMTGRMEYLVGSRSALTPVWRAWGVSVSNPTSQDEVNHTALVYGITGSGKVTVVYPANFTPRDIAHDVPLLAAR
jgi:protein SCO1/2